MEEGMVVSLGTFRFAVTFRFAAIAPPTPAATAATALTAFSFRLDLFFSFDFGEDRLAFISSGTLVSVASAFVEVAFVFFPMVLNEVRERQGETP